MEEEDAVVPPWADDMPVAGGGDTWLAGADVADGGGVFEDSALSLVPCGIDELAGSDMPLTPSDTSSVCAAGSPSSPSAKCEHCQQRLEDMKAAGTAQCMQGARKWEENWTSGCFGACARGCSFCTEHGRPMRACLELCTSATHSSVVFRGSWVSGRRADRPRPSPESASSVAAPVAVAAAAGAPSVASSPQQQAASCCVTPGECLARIKLLSEADWVRPEDAPALEAVLERARSGTCLGFCRAQYCCRVHWCPARYQATGKISAGSSRYQCDSGPHELSVSRKGRHGSDFPFFCGDPDCCGGQWFSRDETHKRKKDRKRARTEAHAASALVSLGPAPGCENAARADVEAERFADSPVIVNIGAEDDEDERREKEDKCPTPSAPGWESLSVGPPLFGEGWPTIAMPPPGYPPVDSARSAQLRLEQLAFPAADPSRLMPIAVGPRLRTFGGRKSLDGASVATSSWSGVSASSVASALRSLVHGEVRVHKWVLTVLSAVTVLSTSSAVAVLLVHFLHTDTGQDDYVDPAVTRRML